MDLVFWTLVIATLWFLLKGNHSAASPVSGSEASPTDVAVPLNADTGQPDGNSLLDSIVAKVQHIESRGQQTDKNGNTLTSPKGALGIMQLMPGTAAQLGVDPNDRDQNIAGGKAYLQQLYERFGNWTDALAAYNWGPGKVQRALQNGTPYPAAVQSYVNQVMG